MTDESPYLVTAQDAARLLNVSATQLYKWRTAGYGPEPVDVGKPGALRRSIRYRRADLLEFAGVNVE